VVGAAQGRRVATGERYEVELLLDALPLDEAGGLGDAAAASDGGEAVELYLGAHRARDSDD
jgi:hypothetical protein